jgi:hypothetical protein
MSEAIKFDREKPRMDLIPAEALWEVGKVMTLGMVKYSAHNWRSGFQWSRLYAAAQRHLNQWIIDEGPDKDSGLSHLSHAACCILMLLTHELLNLGEDDRWKNDSTK